MARIEPRMQHTFPNGFIFTNQTDLPLDVDFDPDVGPGVMTIKVANAETGDLINRWLATPTPEWLTNQRRFSEANDALSAAADVALQMATLERQMRQRNAERAQEQAYRDIANYRTHLGLLDASSRAITRSLKLLREHLSPEQLTAWDRDGYFAVKGNVSGAIYHLTMGGVQRTSDGHQFCLQLVGDEWTPLYDAVLARKILLECDETKFLTTANNLTVGNLGRTRAQLHAMNERTNSQMRRLDAQLNRGFTERMVAATARLFGGTGD